MKLSLFFFSALFVVSGCTNRSQILGSLTGPSGQNGSASTSTPSPSPSSSCTMTSDTLLNAGSPSTNNYLAVGSQNPTFVKASNNPNDSLWMLFPEAYAVKAGSGSINMSYTGSGSVDWTVNLSGLNSAGVNAYPSIEYGNYPGIASNIENGQPPQFPMQLGTLKSLTVDTAYSLTGTITGSRDIDILYDEWVTTTPTWTNGPSATSLEVGIFPYFSFAYGYAGKLVKTFIETVTINGAPTPMSFYEYSTFSSGGFSIFFYAVPNQNLTSGEISFNMLDFLNEGVTTSGNSAYSYLQSLLLGTEFGDSASQNFTFTLTKLGLTACHK